MTQEQRERLSRVIDQAVEHWTLVEFGTDAVHSTSYVTPERSDQQYKVGAFPHTLTVKTI